MSKAKLFWPLVCALLAADCGTKRMAVERWLADGPYEILGGLVRFTPTFNRGAVLGLGTDSALEAILPLLALALLAVLMALYLTARARDRHKVVALALLCGGALGNLIDRLRWSYGVVDFIDVGLGDSRWWTFNLADVGVILGAVLLVWSARARSSGAGHMRAARIRRPHGETDLST